MNEQKEKYKEALLVELMRFVQLQRDDWNMEDEYDLALYSVWYLLNPLELDGRSKMVVQYPRDEVDENGPYKSRCDFTSHSHHNEPLHPSVDDIIIYSRYDDRFCSHFITDRFNIVKIDPTRTYRSYLDLKKPDKNGDISFKIGEYESI